MHIVCIVHRASFCMAQCFHQTVLHLCVLQSLGFLSLHVHRHYCTCSRSWSLHLTCCSWRIFQFWVNWQIVDFLHLLSFLVVPLPQSNEVVMRDVSASRLTSDPVDGTKAKPLPIVSELHVNGTRTSPVRAEDSSDESWMQVTHKARKRVQIVTS
jgi:hypothetical protein